MAATVFISLQIFSVCTSRSFKNWGKSLGYSPVFAGALGPIARARNIWWIVILMLLISVLKRGIFIFLLARSCLIIAQCSVNITESPSNLNFFRGYSHNCYHIFLRSWMSLIMNEWNTFLTVKEYLAFRKKLIGKTIFSLILCAAT